MSTLPSDAPGANPKEIVAAGSWPAWLTVCGPICCFTLASIFIEVALSAGAPEGTRGDIGRIASQVVVGIGFLGAGVIMRHGGQVKGLTTAANLWLTASVGLAAGLGFYFASGATMVIALLALAGLRPLERGIRDYRRRRGLKVDGDMPSSDAQEREPD